MDHQGSPKSQYFSESSAFEHSFIHSFNTHLPNTHYARSTVLGAGDRMVNKTFHGARVLVEKMDEKQYLFKVLSCILGDERGFPGSSPGKGSACNAGDPGSIPESGRTAGEGVGYPLQYSWASLVAQLVKNLPAIWETWV